MPAVNTPDVYVAKENIQPDHQSISASDSGLPFIVAAVPQYRLQQYMGGSEARSTL
jgi:hypothetical protein